MTMESVCFIDRKVIQFSPYQNYSLITFIFPCSLTPICIDRHIQTFLSIKPTPSIVICLVPTTFVVDKEQSIATKENTLQGNNPTFIISQPLNAGLYYHQN